MEIKRLDLDEQIKRFAIRKIKKEIKLAENSVIDEWGVSLRLAPKDKKPEIEKDILNRQFWVRSKVVKRLFNKLSCIPEVPDSSTIPS